ncbi:MAG TPA: hypothetical protein ENJ53_05650, partial [Phaeodactylibacter sp.]|nr:hypothetical protein [Phaeodactylibacter sp.]
MFKRVKKIVAFSVKSVLKMRPSKKTIWKIGLFLVFVGVNCYIGLNFAQAQVFRTTQERKEVMLDAIKNVGAIMGIETDNKGNAVDISNLPIGNSGISFVFEKLLLGISKLIHLLVLASAFIFDMVVKPDISNGKSFFDIVVRDNDSIYIAWAMVRDFLNLFFMLALLFSAFSTIFQVEKYHLKKIIILLVVMALLVNFSYPITRFVMDFSNSAMYFFVGLMQQAANASAASSSSALIAKMSDMGMLSKAVLEKADIPALLLSIIFQFILFVTLFAYAINLLIRILAFAILLIFSPAGFTLSFFPSTGNIASSWWDNLIKYAVMGPLMIFFLLLANLIFNATAQQRFSTPEKLQDIGFIGSSLLFAIPIVFLWIGLIASQKF